MKKMIVSMALLLCFGGSVMAQTDKAAEKAEKAAKKAAEKAAKTLFNDAIKAKDALAAKVQDKSATEDVIFAENKKVADMTSQVLSSGNLHESRHQEAYKMLADAALQCNNTYVANASNKLAFDTAAFVKNLDVMTDALHNEIKLTKVTTGETGNEGYIKSRKLQLSQSAIYYIYAAQFESECKRYDSAIKAYENAMNYKTTYPEVASDVKLPIEDSQIAYYIFHAAHDGGKFDVMEKYYDKAMAFPDGAQGTQQVYLQSFMERGDTATWANKVKDICLKDPENNKEYIQMLLSYYQKKDPALMASFADEILAVNDKVLIANYAKAFILFSSEKYDDALVVYKKCTEIKPDYYDAWYQAGLCKYKQAMSLNSTISNIKNQKEAKAALDKTKTLFGEAIPYFEKAKECEPDDPQKWAYELKQCYSVTGNSAKAAEMDKLL